MYVCIVVFNVPLDTKQWGMLSILSDVCFEVTFITCLLGIDIFQLNWLV